VAATRAHSSPELVPPHQLVRHEQWRRFKQLEAVLKTRLDAIVKTRSTPL
jgi:hypothetical protein